MYKKYTKRIGIPEGYATKIWLIMRLTTVILIATLMQVSAAGLAQKVSLQKSNVPLRAVLRDIKLQTGYNFVVTDNLLKKAKAVSINVSEMQLEDALKQIFDQQPLTYTVEDETVIVRLKEETIFDKVKNQVSNLFFADSVIYKGKISDETNRPMPGATIRLKGKKTAITADENGEFAIYGPRTGAIFVVSYIGYAQKEIKPSSNNDLIQLSMTPAFTDLSGVEIVSTGLQDIPKERATGSFEVITAKQLEHSNDPNLLRRLEGITTSLNFNNQFVNTNSATLLNSQFGAKPLIASQFENSPLRNLTIRGKNTLTGNFSYDQNNQHGIPLVVIDGIASPYSIDQLNPDDIESVVLLKDAAASSIWGSRAANGVIVVNTKKGRFNSPLRINFNANLIVTEKIDLAYNPKMSVSDYIDMEVFSFNQQYNPSVSTAFIGDPVITTRGTATISPVFEILNRHKRGLITLDDRNKQLDMLRSNDIRNDFTDNFLRNAVNQNYSLSIEGGTSKVSQALRTSYTKTLRNTQNSSSNKTTLNYSINVKPFRFLDLDGSIVYGLQNSNNQAVNNAITGITNVNFYPYTRLVDDNGNNLEVPRQFYRPSFVNLVESTYGNRLLSFRWTPLDDINEGYNNATFQNINLGLGARAKLTPWLSLNLNYNYNRGYNEASEYYSVNSFYMRELINNFTTPVSSNTPFVRQIPLGGTFKPVTQKSNSGNLRGVLNVNKSWTKHEVSGIAGVDIADNYVITKSDQYYGYDEEYLRSAVLPVDAISGKPQFFTGGNGPTNIPYSTGFADSKVRTIGVFSNIGYSYDDRYTIAGLIRKDASSEFGVGTNRSGKPFYSLSAMWDVNNEHFYKLKALSTLKLKISYGFQGNVNSTIFPRPFLTFADIVGPQLTGFYTFDQITGISNKELRPERTGTLNLGLVFGFKENRISGTFEYYERKTTDLIAPDPIDPTIGYVTTSLNVANLKGKGIDFIINSTNIKSRKFSWNSSFLFSYNRVKVTKLFTPRPKTLSDVVNSPFSYELGNDLARIYAYRWAGLDPATGDPRTYLNGQIVSIGNTTSLYAAILAQPLSEGKYFGSAVPVYYGSFRNSFSYGRLSASINLMYKLGYYFRRPDAAMLNYGSLFATNTRTLQGVEFNSRWQKPGDELQTNVPSLVYTTNGSDARNTIYRLAEINVQKADHVRLQEINLNYTIKSPSKWFIKNPVIYANVNNLGLVWRANRFGLDPEARDYPNPRQYSVGFRAAF